MTRTSDPPGFYCDPADELGPLFPARGRLRRSGGARRDGGVSSFSASGSCRARRYAGRRSTLADHAPGVRLAGRHPLRVIREIANVALRSLCCAN